MLWSQSKSEFEANKTGLWPLWIILVRLRGRMRALQSFTDIFKFFIEQNMC